jgi:hypothetical protein
VDDEEPILILSSIRGMKVVRWWPGRREALRVYHGSATLCLDIWMPEMDTCSFSSELVPTAQDDDVWQWPIETAVKATAGAYAIEKPLSLEMSRCVKHALDQYWLNKNRTLGPRSEN